MTGVSINEAGFDYSSLCTYSGYLKDDNKLKKSASGGAATAISEAIIRRGGLVIGVTYSSDFKRAEYVCVDAINNLERIKGSKYCEVKKEIEYEGKRENLFTFLERELVEEKTILFIGLGCDVGAVKHVCETKNISTDRLYLLELLCHGTTFSEVHSQYIETIEKRYASKVIAFTVRYKKKGWTPAYIHAEFENGAILETPFYESDYGFAFFRFSRKSCYQCAFKGENHRGDIVVGDFWGAQKGTTQWNKNGVSVLFVRTEKGQKLLDMVDQTEFYLEHAETAYAFSFNRAYFESRKAAPECDKFLQDLTTNGLKHAVSTTKTTKQHMLGIVKKLLPSNTIEALRNLKRIGKN